MSHTYKNEANFSLHVSLDATMLQLEVVDSLWPPRMRLLAHWLVTPLLSSLLHFNFGKGVVKPSHTRMLADTLNFGEVFIVQKPIFTFLGAIHGLN